MSDGADIPGINQRIVELEARMEFLFKHFNLVYERELTDKEMQVGEVLRKGDFMKAISTYRDLFGVDLGAAKKGVEEIKAKLHL